MKKMVVEQLIKRYCVYSEGGLPTCSEYIFLGEETRENLLFYEEKSYQEELMKIESGELNEELYAWIFGKICLFRPGV